MGVVALSFLLIGAAHNMVVAAPAEGMSLPPASIATADSTSCVNVEITFDIEAFDFDPDSVSEVPWVIEHNGVMLSDSILANYLELGALGDSLSDWSGSMSLTFTPTAEGCFTVSVEPYIYYDSFGSLGSQNVVGTTVIVGGAPVTPTLSGFDASAADPVPGGVLLCDGGSTSGALASNTVGEIPMSMSYRFEDAAGMALDSAEVLNQIGDACDGPSINMTFASGPLTVGRYAFIATATNQCGSSVDTLEVEVVRIPNFGLSSAPVCADTNAVVFSDFVLEDYAMSNDSLPMPTAVWSDGGTALDSNMFISPEGGDVFTQEITLVYELFDEQATCVGAADATQVVHIPSTIDLVVTGGINDNLVCEGDSLELSLANVSTFDPEETFVWTSDVPPSSSTSTSRSWESFELDVAGTITQISVWADGTTCNNTLDFDVDVSPMPEVSWFQNDTSICAGSDAGLIIDNISTQAVDVTWELPSGMTDTVLGLPQDNDLIEGILILDGDNFPNSGQYVVLVTPTDALGCAGNPIEGLVEVVDNPTAAATFAETCEGEAVIPTGVVTGSQYSYAWSISGSATLGQGAFTAAPEIDNVACGDAVSLIVTETFVVDGVVLECASAQQTVGLDVVAPPQPELTTDSPLCNGVDVVLDLTDVSNVSGCENDTTIYQWTLDDSMTVMNDSVLGSVTLQDAAFETLNVTIEATATGSGGGCARRCRILCLN